MNTARDTFTKHQGAIYIGLGIVIVFLILYALRSAILPFITGLILAYIFMPLISLIEKKLPKQGKYRQTKRVLLILLIYLIIFGLIFLLSYYIVMAVFNAFLNIMNNASQYIEVAISRVQSWMSSFQQGFPPEVQQKVNEILLDAAIALGNAIKEIFTKGLTTIPSTFHVIFGFATLPIFLFYIMKDWEKLAKSFYSGFSPSVARHIKGVMSVIDLVLGRYIRAQLLLGFVVGYLCFIGLAVLRVPFAPALASLAAITELIPVLGPWIGGIIAVILTLAVAPEKAIWVAILYAVVQLVENNLLVPRIQGGYLHIHPAVVLILLMVGAYVAGIWGMILAVPLTATVVELYKYVRQATKAEESEQNTKES